MPTLSATAARKDFFKLVNDISEGQPPVYIKGKSGKNAVLMSESELSGLRESLYLMCIPGMWQSIEEASKAPRSEFIKWEDLEW